jgi:hypothetical protein
VTYCGGKDGYEFQNAGQKKRTEKPRRTHRMATSRLHPVWLDIFARGRDDRLRTRRQTILSSRYSSDCYRVE